MLRKPSFFERITGSVNVEEEELGQYPANQQAAKVAPAATADEGDAQLTVDVYQTPEAIIVQAMVAGVRPDELDVAITREMVTIRGKREDSREVKDGDYFFKELYWGTFSRTILLPSEVEPEEAEATERHGLLTIRLPKINKEKIQKVRVKGNNQ